MESEKWIKDEKLYYNSHALEYFKSSKDALVWQVPEWLVFAKYLRRSGVKILDLGCGTSPSASKFLRDINVFYVGTDISKALLTFARDSINGHFIQADAQNLPLKIQSFDIAMSLGVLHHVPNYLKGCTEALRVLKDEAVFLLREPSKSVGRIEVSPHERGISEEKLLHICRAYGKILERKAIHTEFLRRPFRLLTKLFHRSPIIFIARARIEFVLDQIGRRASFEPLIGRNFFIVVKRT